MHTYLPKNNYRSTIVDQLINCKHAIFTINQASPARPTCIQRCCTGCGLGTDNAILRPRGPHVASHHWGVPKWLVYNDKSYCFCQGKPQMCFFLFGLIKLNNYPILENNPPGRNASKLGICAAEIDQFRDNFLLLGAQNGQAKGEPSCYPNKAI